MIEFLLWLFLLGLGGHGWLWVEPGFKWSVVAFATAFFFLLGFVRGARAGYALGDAFTFAAIAAILPIAAEGGVTALDGDPRNASEVGDRRGAEFVYQTGPLLVLLAGVLVLGLYGPW